MHLVKRTATGGSHTERKTGLSDSLCTAVLGADYRVGVDQYSVIDMGRLHGVRWHWDRSRHSREHRRPRSFLDISCAVGRIRALL